MSRANLRTATALFILVLTANTLQAQVDVLTAQYNTSRTGSNTQETVLNQTNVNSLQFGKLFSRTVDAGFYASPLIATGVSIPGVGQRNVVYVATLGNTVYAFDADDPAVSNAYWSVNLGASIPRSAYYLGPNIGILGTPVIDRSTNTIYVAAIVRTIDDGLYVYALDLSTGASSSIHHEESPIPSRPASRKQSRARAEEARGCRAPDFCSQTASCTWRRRTSGRSPIQSEARKDSSRHLLPTI